MPPSLTSPRRSDAALPVFVVVLLLLLSRIPFGLSDEDLLLQDHFCDESHPLSTKYFIPFYESSRDAQGCSSEPPLDSPSVHVLKLNNYDSLERDIVLLSVTDHGEYSREHGMVLILLSIHPVNWRISFITNDGHLLKNKHTVILSAGSNIVEKNFRIQNLQQVRESSSRLNSQTIQKYVARHWGNITTYTTVGVAHRIRIALPPADTLPKVCNLNASSSNPGVDAFFIEKKEASGCYHAEMAGTSEFDVYLIDLESAGNSSVQHPSNATVYLSLNPDVTLTEGAALNRDLILVLKSSEPVRWLLQSTDLIGKLTVISNGDDVENFSLASSQRLNIIKKSLPQSLNTFSTSLLTDVERSSSLVSYIKVGLANVLTLVIPPRAKRGLASIYENEDSVLPSEFSRHQAKGNDRSLIVIPEKVAGRSRHVNVSEEYGNLEAYLRSSMVKDCNQKETSVSFPKSIIQKFNVSQLTLNDPSCRSFHNETHIVLKSKGTSCGSLNYFSGKHPMLKNNVRVHVNGESKAILRIPFNCRFKNGFPGFPSSSSSSNVEDSESPDGSNLSYEDLEKYYDTEDEGDYGDEEMYELHISKVVPPTRKGGRGHIESLAKEFGQTATLTVGDVIKVQTSFETRALLNLALERCWLADHSSPDSELLLKEDLWLIWDGCAAHENITVFSTSGERNPAFAFKISREIAKMKKLFIFCVLGLCSPLGSNNGNLQKCTDPTVSCKKSDPSHVGPTAQQLSRRGPFYIIGEEENPEALLHVEEKASGSQGDLFSTTDMNIHQQWSSSIRDKKLGEQFGGSESESPNSGLRSSHVIMVGVPTEVAVAISIASFIIGASLTGILCCLHHKKMVPKESSRRNMHELRHLNVRADPGDPIGELQSMIQSSTVAAVQT